MHNATLIRRVGATLGAGALAMAGVVGLPGTPGLAGAPSPAPGAGRAADVAPGMSHAAVATVVRVEGVSRDEAVRRLRAQEGQAVTAARLAAALGPARTAGAWIDGRTGDLVVNVTDDEAAGAVRAAGARPQRVRFSTATLQDVRRRLSPLLTSGGAVESVSTDESANRVVVRMSAAGLAGRAARAARAAGPAVTVERGVGAAIPSAGRSVWPGFDRLATGSRTCTAGYAARQKATGLHVIVTAAHCVLPQVPPVLSGIDGTTFGHTSSIIHNRDVAAVTNDFPFFWALGPQLWTFAHGAQTVSQPVTALKGSFVCKAGITTGETCGKVIRTGFASSRVIGNQTLTVIDQTEVDMCGKRGDSGGPVYFPSSLTPGRVGIAGTGTSSIVYDRPRHEITDPAYTGPEYCGSETMPDGRPIDAPQRMYYQPSVPALAAMGLTALTG